MSYYIPQENGEDRLDKKVDFALACGGMIALFVAVFCLMFFGGCGTATGDPIVSPNHEPAADAPTVPAQGETYVPYIPWWVKEK